MTRTDEVEVGDIWSAKVAGRHCHVRVERKVADTTGRVKFRLINITTGHLLPKLRCSTFLRSLVPRELYKPILQGPICPACAWLEMSGSSLDLPKALSSCLKPNHGLTPEVSRQLDMQVGRDWLRKAEERERKNQ